MKLKVLQEDLLRTLSQVNRFVNPRVQLPILGNIIFKSGKTKLLLKATNLELSIVKEIGASVEEEGEIAIPGKTIFEIVSNLSKGQIELEAKKEQLKIKSENFTGNISGMGTSDFPKVIDSLGKGSIILELTQLKEALSKVSFCASVDETRPVLNGVLFIFKKKELILVATDGFRLSQKTIQLKEEIDLERIIIPKSAILELLRTEIEGNDINLEVVPSHGQIVFGVGDGVFASRLISGEFPNFENIIPKSSTTKVFVDKTELLRVVKLASVFARDNANMVSFSVEKNTLKVSAESSKSGKQEAQVEVKVEGAEVDIIFNYKFLEEVLNVIEGEEVQIELTNTTSPGVFRDPKDSNFLHLIMPVRIQS